MAELIGLIERAAALLRQREAGETAPSPAETVPAPAPASTAAGAAEAAEPATGPELILDRGQLAGYGITIPSARALADGRGIPPDQAEFDCQHGAGQCV